MVLRSLSLLLALLLFLVAAPAYCAGWRGSVGLGVEFASGSFGTASRSDAVAAPLTIALYPSDRLDFSLEIPYLHQKGGSVTSSVNRNIAIQQMHMKEAGMGAVGGNAMAFPPSQPQGNPTLSSNGIGDLTLKGGYILLPEGERLPALRASLSVKIPTADKEKALGTGAFDEGATLELSKWLGSWYSFAGVGYTVLGKVEGVPLKNVFTYSGSVGYQLTARLLPLLMVKATTPAADDTGSTLLAKLKTLYLLTDKTSIEGYLSRGFTSASPDFGAGIAIFHYF